MSADPYYVAARRVLLDALEDLAEHRDAIVVVGAQAVYLRCGATNVGVAEYTTDGDLAVDSDRLTDIPLLEDVMGVRFGHVLGPTGAEQPGVWTRTVEVDGELIDIPVDLIVPEGIAPPGGSRGARLGLHGKRAARKAAGLEAAILDNDELTIRALEPEDARAIDSRVAGPTALLIAKAHKIQDRLEQSARPDRLIDKDASDVYRLMLTTPAEDQRSRGNAARRRSGRRVGTARARVASSPVRRAARARCGDGRPRAPPWRSGGPHPDRLRQLRSGAFVEGERMRRSPGELGAHHRADRWVLAGDRRVRREAVRSARHSSDRALLVLAP